jgi:hypothetical protein
MPTPEEWQVLLQYQQQLTAYVVRERELNRIGTDPKRLFVGHEGYGGEGLVGGMDAT